MKDPKPNTTGALILLALIVIGYCLYIYTDSKLYWNGVYRNIVSRYTGEQYGAPFLDWSKIK